MSEASPVNFEKPVVVGRKQIRGRFVIPSGIRCTRASSIQWCFAEVDSVGVVTTKSISLGPRAGYREPIYARYAPECYINAVGLSNPGAEQFRHELEQISIPRDKFLLVSIFGGDVEQFVQTALALRSVADGFELNMSCPHAKGYGIEIGQRCELVSEITAAVVGATQLPVFVKLSAIVADIGQTARAAVQCGAAGITVSNTVGPATVNLGSSPVLSNKVGGLSGTGIRPLALQSVSRVRAAIGQGPLIIGMGGVSTCEDVRQFYEAGADLIGIGSALTGLNSEQMQAYFASLHSELRNNQIRTTRFPPITMDYFPATIVAREEYHPGLFKVILDKLPGSPGPGELAGKYFFLFMPGIGEKPFAIFSADEKSIVVRVAGQFTQHLAGVSPGTPVFLRGPYGKPFPPVQNRRVVLVGGGTGIASLFEIARLLQHGNELHFFLGGRTAPDVFDLEKFSALGSVRTSTDDGSAGHRGFVSDLLTEWIGGPGGAGPTALYVLCGPEPMVQTCLRLLEKKTQPENVWASIEYMTSCGVGICGKCACPSGKLTCIDGPFLQSPAFQSRNGGNGLD